MNVTTPVAVFKLQTPSAVVIVVWTPAVAVSKSTVNCPTPFTGALGLPSTSVSFVITLTVPSAPSSVNGVALWSSSLATGIALIAKFTAFEETFAQTKLDSLMINL